MRVKASDELLDELIAQYKDADPMENTRDFGILLALKETKMYRDTGLSPEQVAELATAHRDGRLVVLPCRIGDPIFGVWEDDTFCSEINNIKPPYIKELKFTPYWIDKVGKTVFLTREEAEAVLSAQKGNHDER